MSSVLLPDELSPTDEPITTSFASTDGHFTQRGIVTLLVGETEEKFEIHETLLCEKSKFFAKCLQPGFQENKSGKVVLHEESAKSVQVMVEWLYSNRVADINMDSFDLIAGTYKMADKFMMNGLKNALMDKLRIHQSQKNTYFHTTSFCKLYDETMTSMPLHKYMLKRIVFNCMTYTAAWNTEKKHQKAMDDIVQHAIACRDFLGEILAFKEAPYANPATGTGCLYHDHTEDKSCAIGAARVTMF